MNTYRVEAYREGPWWMVAIPELDGLTQARSFGEVDVMARDYIAVWLDLPPDSFDVTVSVRSVGPVTDIEATISAVEWQRTEAARLSAEATANAADLAKRLADEHVSVRDIGRIMGLSYQRAHQLVHA